jgi:hypothetical protein
MPARRAIDLALDLSRTPELAPVLRQQALPSDLLETIRVAAGCEAAINAAVESSRGTREAIRIAAIYYLQEILFFPGASAYRNLGVAANASRSQMRVNMRWLMQWLHPDHNSDGNSALLAIRVIDAWHQLERRNKPKEINSAPRYSVRGLSSRANVSHHATVRVRWIRVPTLAPRNRRKTILFFLMIATFLALVLLVDLAPLGWFSYNDRGMTGSLTAKRSEASATNFLGVVDK